LIQDQPSSQKQSHQEKEKNQQNQTKRDFESTELAFRIENREKKSREIDRISFNFNFDPSSSSPVQLLGAQNGDVAHFHSPRPAGQCGAPGCVRIALEALWGYWLTFRI
jgi:hypothetical protein